MIRGAFATNDERVARVRDKHGLLVCISNFYPESGAKRAMCARM